ncbi:MULTISPECIES: hypothetical protein [Agrobacterium tumefaciens complex]|jgi:hypothetical protein|uniref:hypothetical protein n=1 Tax=Agrobacterium tumefaciens complex TaxID=1183400 RepID=UPI0013AF6B35|nr:MULTISPECIES: hypothetical protein [Agrobacterium tumefaciens complex]MBB4406035.1 hypothetical protein [Agrobacterium radiobacter]MBB4450557.1 hypothetical protein [Agrobacterium radiobacter]MDR6588455.1 hypothetical protein [Agrobacterium tumefaciens]
MRKYLSASPVKAGYSRSATRMHVLCQIGSGLEEKTSIPRPSDTKCIRFGGFSANFSREPEKSISISANSYYFRWFEYLRMRECDEVGLFIFYAFDYYLDLAICLFLYRLPFRRFEGMIEA